MEKHLEVQRRNRRRGKDDESSVREEKEKLAREKSQITTFSAASGIIDAEESGGLLEEASGASQIVSADNISDNNTPTEQAPVIARVDGETRRFASPEAALDYFQAREEAEVEEDIEEVGEDGSGMNQANNMEEQGTMEMRVRVEESASQEKDGLENEVNTANEEPVPERKRRYPSGSPSEGVETVLGAATGGSESSSLEGEAGIVDANSRDEASASFSATSNSSNYQDQPLPGRQRDHGRSLIQKLRESAKSYAETGVHPDIVESLADALKGKNGAAGFYNGIERVEKLRELEQINRHHDFMSIIENGMGSTENFNTLIRSKVLVGDLKGAFEVHDLMKTHGFDVDAETYVSFVIGASKLYEERNLELVKEVAVMQSQDHLNQNQNPDLGLQIRQQLHMNSLNACKLSKKLYLQMRENLISPTSKIFGALMKCHVKHGDLGGAQGFLEKMENEHPELINIVHYTTLIDGYVENNMHDKAWDLFHNVRTWKSGMGISAHTSSGYTPAEITNNHHASLMVTDPLTGSNPHLNLAPDEVLFTVMIKSCRKNEESEKALGLLDDMRACGLYPTDITYTELIGACASRPDFARRAFEFKNQKEAEDMPLGLQDYEYLFEACKNMPSLKRSQMLMGEIMARNERVEMNKERGENGLSETFEEVITLTPKCYEHMIGCFANNQLLDLRWHVNSSNAHPDAILAPKGQNLVSERERIQNLRHAWLVIADARAKKMPVTCSFLNEVLDVYVKGGFSGYAVEMLSQFAHFNLRPDFRTYEILLGMFHRERDMGRFFSLWDLCGDQHVCEEFLLANNWEDDEGFRGDETMDIVREMQNQSNHGSENQQGQIEGASESDGTSTTNTDSKPETSLLLAPALLESLASLDNSNSLSNNPNSVPIVSHNLLIPVSIRKERATKVYNMALEMAISSKSSNRTCKVLNEMLELNGQVFPSPQIADRLAKVGRHVLEIHRLVQKFIDMNKLVTYNKVKKRQELLDAELQEYKLRCAKDGLKDGQTTAYLKARDKNFRTLKKQGAFKRPFLPIGEYHKHKKKGGDYYSRRVDKPKPAPRLPA